MIGKKNWDNVMPLMELVHVLHDKHHTNTMLSKAMDAVKNLQQEVHKLNKGHIILIVTLW